MINLGSDSISNIMIGNTQVQKMYLGTSLILEYSSGEEIDMNAPIVFEDSAVETILLSKYDTSNKGYLTPNDLSQVTTLNNVFKNNTDITKFNEFKYFTGLSSNNNEPSYVYVNNYFSGCTALTDITFPVLSNNRLFRWHNQYSDRSPLYNCSSLVNVNLNNALFDVEWCVSFYRGCSSLQWSQSLIPNNWTALPNSMFHNTTNLGFAVIPEGIISNNSDTFNSSKTSYIIFPKSFETLNLNHMTRDNKITSGINIYLKRTSSITQLVSTSTGYNRNLVFYVPDDLLDDYQADSSWSTVLSATKWKIYGDSNLPADLQKYKD